MDAKLEAAVARSVEYLSSEKAAAQLRREPYWPKWDSPWWHMTLLWELRLAYRIPRATAIAMAEAMGDRYLKRFPASAEELPRGKTLEQDVACHCALGTMYQVLCDAGVSVESELPWIRRWFLRYQLPDGGLNCDERAYGNPRRKSSIVSTMPPLESVLFHTHRSFTKTEIAFLDRGAGYLIEHKLFRSVGGGGKIIQGDWLRVIFPRFYEYDVLRGLHFLVHWALLLDRELPLSAVIETLDALRRNFREDRLSVQRCDTPKTNSLVLDSKGRWTGSKAPSSSFALLDAVSPVGRECPPLSATWQRTLEATRTLRERGKLVVDRPEQFVAWSAQ